MPGLLCLATCGALRCRERCRAQPCPAHTRPPAHALLPPQASAEDELRKMTSGMTAGDAIKRILLAAKDKDYFR